MTFYHGHSKKGFNRVLFYFSTLCLCIVSISLIKIYAIYGGWAEIDSRKFHFILINYFIQNGFNLHYPQLLPMYPGMHLFFAFLARFWHLQGLAPTDWTSFAIQSIWGICFLAGALAIALRLQARVPHVEVPIILLILLCSSYPIASWIWPTTELGAFAMLYGMYALMIGRGSLSLAEACLYAGLVAIATLFRQNYAIFAAAPLATYLSRCLGGLDKISLKTVGVTGIPLFAAALIVVPFTILWGGLIPAELARHGGAGHFEVAQIQNMVALIGLIGLPFVVLSLQTLWHDRVVLVGLLVLSLGLAVASETLAPMVYDYEAGSWGSLTWTIVLWQTTHHLHAIPLVVVSAAGWFVCLTILARSLRERCLSPEVFMLGLLGVSLLPQAYVYQRYSEVPILATLAIFFLSRLELKGLTRWFVFGWYATYMIVSLVRPLVALGSLSG